MRKVALCLFGLFLAGDAAGFSVTVGCPGGSPGTYPSLTAALAVLQPQPQLFHLIQVSGTCTENVEIEGFSELHIIGTPSATILDTGLGSPTAPPAIIVTRRSNVRLENLTLGATGSAAPFVPLIVGGGANTVELTKCTLQGGSFPGGMWVQRDGSASLQGVTIQDNGNSGVRVDAGASLLVAEGFLPWGPSVIQRNPFAGITLSDSATLLFRDGGNVIRSNGTGINSAGGSVFLCCDGGSKIVENRVGIRANGGTVRVNSPFEIDGNSIGGILLTGANAALNTVLLRNNGTAGDPTSGAVLAEGSSHVDLFSSEVTGNRGSGLVLRDNSSARVFQNVITGNGGSGIRATALSTVTLFAGNGIEGNSDYDLFCAPNSFGSGNADGVKKMFCAGFDRSPLPNGGGSPEP
jgi:hypothetical protein